MKYYEDFLKKKNKEVIYVNQHEIYSDITKFIPYLKTNGFNHINYILTEDNYLDKRILSISKEYSISINFLDSPMFLNKRSDLDFFDKKKKKFFQTSFYINQRKKFNVLLKNDEKPVG